MDQSGEMFSALFTALGLAIMNDELIAVKVLLDDGRATILTAEGR